MQKVAIVGLGFMGTMHLQVYAQIKDVRVVAVLDKQKNKAERDLAKLKLDIPVFESLDRLLAACEVDIIDICLPTNLHAPFVLKAISAGKHVFCEKPLALTN